MVHPSVPAILFTPICPHSLSFRPVLLPDSAELELRVPDDARDTAWVCFDGKKRQQLQRGDSVTIRMSAHPLPTINKRDQTDDWVASLTEVRTKRNERMMLLECGGGLQAKEHLIIFSYDQVHLTKAL